MMIRTAGGPSVSPIDFNERRTPRFTRNTWIAIAIVGSAHVGLGAVLYAQRFELKPPVATPSNPIDVEIWRPQKEPPPPAIEPEIKPQPANTVFNETPAPPVNTEVVTAVSGDTPTSGTTITLAIPVPEPTPEAPPAPPQPPQPPLIRNPSWSSQPSGEQMMRAYPNRAVQANIEGSVGMNCLVNSNGSVSDCNVVRETPGSYGFGRAAQSLSRYFRINPRTVNGAAEGSRVNINLRFNLPE